MEFIVISLILMHHLQEGKKSLCLLMPCIFSVWPSKSQLFQLIFNIYIQLVNHKTYLQYVQLEAGELSCLSMTRNLLRVYTRH